MSRRVRPEPPSNGVRLTYVNGEQLQYAMYVARLSFATPKAYKSTKTREIDLYNYKKERMCIFLTPPDWPAPSLCSKKKVGRRRFPVADGDGEGVGGRQPFDGRVVGAAVDVR